MKQVSASAAQNVASLLPGCDNGQSTKKLGNGNGHATVGSKEPAMQTEQIAQDVTTLLMSLMRDLFAVEDDQASELPLRQLRVCAMLYEGSRSMSSLSRELGVSLPAMTQIADRLERARLVKRSFAGTDRRVRSLQLTARAQRIMRLREESRVHRASAALEQLPATERTSVLTTLRALSSACSTWKNNSNGAKQSSTNGDGVHVSIGQEKLTHGNGNRNGNGDNTERL